MGDAVEVWCRSTGRWVAGYRVVERRHDGSVLVAHADGVPLPVPLDEDAVRDVAPVPLAGWRPPGPGRPGSGSSGRSVP